MPLPSTRVVHPKWSEHYAQTTDEAENSRIQILAGTSEDWVPGEGATSGEGNVLYDGPARVTYDLDRAITKDNADQVTSVGTVLVALRRSVPSHVAQPGNTVRVVEGDVNGPLGDFVQRTLRVLTVRVSGYSWGTLLDCHESAGRTNG